MVAGVHADLALTGLDDLGWKAMAAAVSDIAAMGGEPGHAVVAVAAPPGTDLAMLYEGLGGAASAYRCPVVGGDLAALRALVVAVDRDRSCDGEPVLRAAPGQVMSLGHRTARGRGRRVAESTAPSGEGAPRRCPDATSSLAAHARPTAPSWTPAGRPPARRGDAP